MTELEVRRTLSAELLAFWAEQLQTLTAAWQRQMLALLASRYGAPDAERIRKAACL